MVVVTSSCKIKILFEHTIGTEICVGAESGQDGGVIALYVYYISRALLG